MAIVLPEPRDRLEIRAKPTGEPDQFEIAFRLALKSPARLDPIEVAVDVDLQQYGRMVSWASIEAAVDALETQLA